MSEQEENGVVNKSAEQLIKLISEENISLERFSPTFHEFVRRNPSKEDIKIVSKLMKQKIKEANKYKPVVDSFVVLMSLFALELQDAEKGKGSSEANLQIFTENVDKIEMKLKKQDLVKWIKRVQTNVTDEVKYSYREKQFQTLRDLSIEEKKRDEEAISQLKIERCNLENALRTIINKLGMNTVPNPIEMMDSIIEKLNKIQKQANLKETLEKKVAELTKSNEELLKQNNDLTYKLKIQQRDFNRKIQILQKQVAVAVSNRQEIMEVTPIEFRKTFSNSFIDSKILTPKQSGEMMFLRKSTEKITKLKPKFSELLFSSQTDLWSDIHSKIDGRPNILLLIRLKNRKIVGAFTQQPIEPNCTGEKAYLFCIAQFEYYERVQGSTIAYDANSLIFGKNEFTLSNSTLHCELGVAGGVFNSKGRSLSFFLGEGAGVETQVESFEVHELRMSDV